MAKLILSMDGLVLKEITLDKERLSIGRKPHNDIQIDNLAISGEHAVIVSILNDSFLEDLNSTNGTLVNGQAIKKHFLRHNDVIELGKYKLKYMVDQGVAAHDPGQTTLGHAGSNKAALDALSLSNDPAAQTSPGTQARPVEATLELPPAAIQLLNGPNAGKELELTKSLTTLGKPGTQVAVIARRPHGYFITHVEGATFPLVNGRAIDAQAHALTDHDVVEIAGVKMEFFLRA